MRAVTHVTDVTDYPVPLHTRTRAREWVIRKKGYIGNNGYTRRPEVRVVCAAALSLSVSCEASDD